MTVLNQRKRISAEDNIIVKNIEMTLAENNDIVFKFYKQNYINELSEEEISTFNISLGEYYKKSYIDDYFYTKSELDTKFDSLVGFTVSIVSELPSTGENGVMYLVPSADGETGNTYIEYIWADNKFEKIGDTTTKVNLTDYYTKAQVDSQISTQMQNYHLGVFRDELTRKADKTHTHEDATINKSGFMSASDKSKLDSLNESGDITIDTSLSLTSGNPVSNRVITQALNGKASTDAVSTSLNGLMSKDDKIKLDGIEEQANAYVLPFAEDTVLGGVKLREKLDPAPADTRIGLGLDNGVLSIKGLLASQIFIYPSSLGVGDKTQYDFNTYIYNRIKTKADATHTHDVATQNINGFLSKEDKVKLDGIAEGANKTIVDSSLSGSSTNPVQNKVVKGALDSKAGTSIATGSDNGLMSSTDKNKLNGIAIGANKTIVDASLSGSSTNPVQNKVVNNALNGKANSSHNHSISNITNLQSTLNSKSDTGHTHDDRYYTETEMDSKLNGKANTSHTHSNIYYTKNEIDTRLGDIKTILNEILGV